MDLAWNDVHRTILQGFVRSPSQCFTYNEIVDITCSACEALGDDYKFDETLLNNLLMDTIKTELETYGIDLKKQQCHITTVTNFALVNTMNDEATANDQIAQSSALIATDLQYAELEVFKKWLNAIVLSGTPDGNPNGERWSVGPTEAAALASGDKLSAVKAQYLSDRLVHERWLVRMTNQTNAALNGRLALGPRSLMELEIYLRQYYQDFIENCSQCAKILTIGERCSNEDCDIKYHRYCLARLYRNQQELRCQCGSLYNFDIDTVEVRQQAASPIQGKKKKNKQDDDLLDQYEQEDNVRSTRRQMKKLDSEEEEEEQQQQQQVEVEQEEVVPKHQSRKQKAQKEESVPKSRYSKKVVQYSSDEEEVESEEEVPKRRRSVNR